MAPFFLTLCSTVLTGVVSLQTLGFAEIKTSDPNEADN